MTHLYISYVVMLAIATIASITDLRSGLIPNRLTLPALAIAPLLEAALFGWRGFIGALLGILICGLVPLIFHRLGAMGGGDVKLFAVLGALGGPSMGLEIELLALSLAFFWGLLLLAHRGQLWRSLGTSGRLMFNVLLPESRRRSIPRELTSLRIGAAILAATALAILDRAWFGGLLS
ncbi:MAG TPA: A24 family peptidase [Polyangiales bacterium]|nr:A24 family peptidase [Polyangiales bacterium]